MNTLHKKLLGAGSYLTINKFLLKNVGLDASFLFSTLIDFEDYLESKSQIESDSWFYAGRDKIEEVTTLSAYKQKEAEKILIQEGLIKLKLKGVPARNHYKICSDQVMKIFENWMSKNLMSSNEKISEHITNKETIKKETKEREGTPHPDLNKFMELSKQYLPEILDSPILYSIWNAVRTYEDWEKYFIWGCENKKDKKETIYKDIAWKDWFRKDYHIAKLAKEKDKEPSYNSNYPHQTYEREVEPQLTDEQIEENKKHMAEMLKTLKINLKKV